MTTNVLLTCAGRRNYLVEYFREALQGRGLVMAADASMDAPAMQEADRAFVVPSVNDAAYVPELVALCRSNKVGLLASLNDLELPVLAAHRDAFVAVGTTPVVSAPEAVRVCFDKLATVRFVTGCGLRAPATYDTLSSALDAISSGVLAFPVVLKPRWGTASVGIEYPEDLEELEATYTVAQRRIRRTILAQASASDPERCLLIQERLVGQEYGLDVVNDLSGRHAATFVKRKLAMRAGETDRAETVACPELEAVGQALGTQLAHVGNLDCDVFMVNGKPYVLELNPRFGGGYPFSHVAGANVPAALLAWVAGREARPEWLRVSPGVLASKCDRLVIATVGRG